MVMVYVLYFESLQMVNIDGFQSEPFTTTSGVPPGSNLVPLFFLLFRNNLKDYFEFCKIRRVT